MACRLVGAKPLSEPMLEYCQFHHWEQTSVKCKSKFNMSHWRKCIKNVVCEMAAILSRPQCVNPCLGQHHTALLGMLPNEHFLLISNEGYYEIWKHPLVTEFYITPFLQAFIFQCVEKVRHTDPEVTHSSDPFMQSQQTQGTDLKDSHTIMALYCFVISSNCGSLFWMFIEFFFLICNKFCRNIC